MWTLSQPHINLLETVSDVLLFVLIATTIFILKTIPAEIKTDGGGIHVITV